MTAAQGAGPDLGPAADVAYQSIRVQILSGERPGGEWLREDELAAVLGVSRTPVREALRRLATEGLVTHEPNRGVQVHNWTIEDLQEVFGLRSLLEPWACAQAAARGQADLAALQDLADRMDAAVNTAHPDFEALTELNNRFHATILAASGSRRVQSLVSSMVDVPLVWRTFARYSPEELRRSLAHHHEMIDALRANDPAWAESIMRAHVQSAWSSTRRHAKKAAGTA